MKKFSYKDIIFLAVLLLCGLALSVIIFCFREDGSNVSIYVDGSLYASYSLNEDRVIKIGEDETNTVVIADGEVYMSEANCPDKICVHSGKKSHDGDSIVCLPHKVVIAVEGYDKELDSISR